MQIEIVSLSVLFILIKHYEVRIFYSTVEAYHGTHSGVAMLNLLKNHWIWKRVALRPLICIIASKCLLL